MLKMSLDRVVVESRLCSSQASLVHLSFDLRVVWVTAPSVHLRRCKVKINHDYFFVLCCAVIDDSRHLFVFWCKEKWYLRFSTHHEELRAEASRIVRLVCQPHFLVLSIFLLKGLGILFLPVGSMCPCALTLGRAGHARLVPSGTGRAVQILRTARVQIRWQLPRIILLMIECYGLSPQSDARPQHSNVSFYIVKQLGLSCYLVRPKI